MKVRVLKSTDTWYGMTYKEDGPAVRESIERLVRDGGTRWSCDGTVLSD